MLQLIIRLSDPTPGSPFAVEFDSKSWKISFESTDVRRLEELDEDIDALQRLLWDIRRQNSQARLSQSFPQYVLKLRGSRGRDHALALFFRLTLPLDPNDELDRNEIKRIEQNLSGSRLVGNVTRSLGTRPASISQDYVEPSDKGGVDAQFAWEIDEEGFRGEKVRACLIDDGYQWKHEGLDGNTVETPPDPPGNYYDAFQIDYVPGTGPGAEDHGTACLGIVVAIPSDTVTGIAHGLEKCWVSSIQTSHGIPEALRAAGVSVIEGVPEINCQLDAALGSPAKILDRGDVIWIPKQTNDGKPVEAEEDIRKAIRTAVEVDGYVVIEAAGNRRHDLDQLTGEVVAVEEHENHSLAIMVGAGNGASRTRWFDSPNLGSNYGSRIDCQGWGKGIATTQYSFETENGVEPSDLYTGQFFGTSGASSMIAGVVAVVQSVNNATGKEPIDPGKMRGALQTRGQPQPDVDQGRIGSLPDIRDLLWHFDLLPNVYLRDSHADEGEAEPSGSQPFVKSLDIVPRRQTEADPEASFGGSKWNVDCGQNLAQDDPSWIYLRVQNGGPFKDEPTIRLYWAGLGNESDPSEWKQIGQDELVPLAPGERKVVGGLKREATPAVGNLCLIAVVSSKFHRGLKAEPDSILPDDLDFLRQHRKIAYRRVTGKKKCCGCLFP